MAKEEAKEAKELASKKGLEIDRSLTKLVAALPKSSSSLESEAFAGSRFLAGALVPSYCLFLVVIFLAHRIALFSVLVACSIFLLTCFYSSEFGF